MRRFAIFLVSALTLVIASAGLARAAPAPTAQIKSKTSEIYMYDPSPAGTGEIFYPATRVTTVLKHCPEGEHRLSATLTQDGVSLPWATTAHGAGELFCRGDDRKSTITVGFYGPNLHPGTATATFALEDGSGTSTVEEVSRVVRIPG